MTLEEAEKEVFNNKKNEPTESVFGNQSIFEDSGPTVSVFSSGFSALTPARERYLPNGACAWYSNIGGREVNEDSVQVGSFKDSVIAVVADGLGGEGDGEKASEIICESLMKCGSDGSFPDRAAVNRP